MEETVCERVPKTKQRFGRGLVSFHKPLGLKHAAPRGALEFGLYQINRDGRTKTFPVLSIYRATTASRLNVVRRRFSQGSSRTRNPGL